LHTIGGNASVVTTDPWIEKHIFPNGMLPSIAQLGKSIEGLFVMEDWHNFGPHYDKTLMAWHANFEHSWETLKKNPKYDERFKRMWEYYLLLCAGSFRSRKNQLWQVVLSPHGVPGGYTTVR
jgi:cyclopropane-fatty-acyl-phospholipid synthase